MDPHASRLVGPVTVYSAPQGSSGFSNRPWSGTDLFNQLLDLRQGSLSIEEYVTQFCEISDKVHFDEVCLKEIFRFGLSKVMVSLKDFMDYALMVAGSSFTVGVAEEERDTASVTEMADAPECTHKMAATATGHFNTAIHESGKVTASHCESNQVTADHQESLHITTDLPESSHVTTGLPESRHISAVHPESRHVTTNHPDSSSDTGNIHESGHDSTDRHEASHVYADPPESLHVSADPPESLHVSVDNPEPAPSHELTESAPPESRSHPAHLLRWSRPAHLLRWFRPVQRFPSTPETQPLQSAPKCPAMYTRPIMSRSGKLVPL